LRRELRGLLESYEAAGNFLEGGKAPTLEGRQLGPWKLGALLGMGGMGDVYRAERADGQFEMSVAVKVMGAGLMTEEGRKRFLVERQILARLDHAGIARLVDGGITEEGDPYLVMEYVAGRPFGGSDCGDGEESEAGTVSGDCAGCGVCASATGGACGSEAVECAGEGGWNAEAVGFGIAWADREEFWAGGGGLTPSYASPEQRRGERPTVASDVYGLGLLLREIAGAYATEPDLAAVIECATAEEAQRRYASVERLVGEVENILARRPVSVRSGSAWYVLGRYAQRHWFALSCALAIVFVAAYAVEKGRVAEQNFVELRRAARIMVFDVYEGIQYLNPPPDVMERIVESSSQVLEALEQAKQGEPGLKFDIASAEERLAELLIVSGGDGQRADGLLRHSFETVQGLLRLEEGKSSYHRLAASALQYVAQRHAEAGRSEEALEALERMGRHVKRALALPEPKSRDWMYLSLIDLRRGEIEREAGLRRAIERIERRDKESPFRDVRHLYLALEERLKLAGRRPRDLAAVLADYEREAGLLRSAGRMGAMMEMKHGLELARIDGSRREAARGRAIEAARLIETTQGASPAYHVLRGDLEAAAGDRGAARRSYERALGVNQSHSEALGKVFAIRLAGFGQLTGEKRCGEYRELETMARRLGREKELPGVECGGR
jgi:hypothetical protein